jgi:GT2 family glycosyltransferase
LYRQEFQDFHTIVVDNGSSDESVPFIREQYPQVTVICLEKNTGFSAAVNAGIAAANTPYVALLNNDTEVHPLWLSEIVRAIDDAPQAGSAASKILFYPETESVNSAGDEFSFFGVADQIRLKRGDSNLFNESTYVFSACAAAALYRKQLFETIGWFDEAFFAYQEDVDIGFRAQLAGYRCLFVPKAIVYHKHEMTSSRVPSLRIYLNDRNKYFVLIKNLPTRLILFCLPLIAAQEAFCFIKALRRGYLGVYFKALKDVWSHFPQMLRNRRYIQTHRVVDDAYVRKLMRFKEPVRFFFYQLGALRSVKS